MFYKQDKADELTAAQMEAARKAFRGKLLRLRYSPRFIVNNADELLAIAHSEYARAVEQGTEIEDPVAWTIHCAWRRTQNLLQAESIRPRSVSSDEVTELVDDGRMSPEDEVLEDDRARKIREAVAKLDEYQRQIIALTFFEEMSVREAARLLGCSASSVQHRRETALRSLRRFLPVLDSEELVVDVAMACWLSFAVDRAGISLPAGFEAVIDRTGREASGFWARVHDLARRWSVGGGNETATAIASGGGGRAAGFCATGIAVVCLAGAGTAGLVGHGIGAITGGGHPSPKTRKAPHRRDEAVAPRKRSGSDRREPSSATSEETAAAPLTVSAGRTGSTGARTRTTSARQEQTTPKQKRRSSTKTTVRHAEATQVREESSGIARAGDEAPAVTPSLATASDEGQTTAPTVVHTETPAASSASKASAAEEFDFEK